MKLTDEFINKLMQSLKLILEGKYIELSPLIDNPLYSDEEKEVVNLLNEVVSKYKEAMNFVTKLSTGDLSQRPPYKNFMVDPFKQLHSELKHLVWQTERLAAGDLSQHVDFLGTFSDSFNSLIEALRERRALTEEIRKSKDFYKALIKIAPDGICNVSLSGTITYISDTGFKMFGYSNYSEMVGKKIFGFIVTKYHEEIASLFDLLLRDKPTGICEYQVVHKNGTIFWNESNMAILRNEIGYPEAFLIMFRDSTKRQLMEQQLKEYSVILESRARTDQMTGFLNHTEGIKILSIELNKAERSNLPLSVCFIDMDYLKCVNDTYGHIEGDLMILSLTRCIKESTRNSDYICRMGGDEFLIIFPECTTDEIINVIDRIYEKTKDINKKTKFKKPLSFSYGFSTSTPQMRFSPEDIIKTADKNMYDQKHSKKKSRDCLEHKS